MSDKIEKDVRELGEYKHIYMVAKQSIESVLVGAYEKLELVDAAIMKKVPDARLVPVEVICKLYPVSMVPLLYCYYC